MSSTDNLLDVEQKIRALADAELATGHPYLLSKLGKDLGADLGTIKSSGQLLATFIRNRLADKYEVVLGGTFRNVQSIVLKQSASNTRTNSIEFSASPRKSIRFNYRFWAAFSVPYTDKRRFLNLDDFTFIDADEAPSANYIEVEPEFIASENAQDRDKVISESIMLWISKKQLEADKFIAKPPEKSGSSKASLSAERTLLHAFVEALDRKQLASVSLPMDVVAALLARRV